MFRRIRRVMEQVLFFIYNRITSLVTTLDERKVVFAAEARPELVGNLKAVYNALPDTVEKRVYVKKNRETSDSVSEKIQQWKDLSTAKFIILDDYYGIISSMKVRKGQELIQLWHGSGAYKRFGYSRVALGEPVARIHKGYRKYTRVTVTSDEVRSCFAEAFDIGIDKVYAVGSPRTDMFYDDGMKQDVYDRVLRAYPQIEGKRTVLVAPTYRGVSGRKDAFYDYDLINLERVVEQLGKDYIILTKWHPALVNNGNSKKAEYSSDNILDVSEYPDINDLLVTSDILITDYSSVIFDWYLLNKPIIYFAYDLDEYKDDRGFYFPFEDYIYGPVIQSSEDLAEAIAAGETDIEARRRFGEKFMSACDGRSTERVIEWIVGE